MSYFPEGPTGGPIIVSETPEYEVIGAAALSGNPEERALVPFARGIVEELPQDLVETVQASRHLLKSALPRLLKARQIEAWITLAATQQRTYEFILGFLLSEAREAKLYLELGHTSFYEWMTICELGDIAEQAIRHWQAYQKLEPFGIEFGDVAELTPPKVDHLLRGGRDMERQYRGVITNHPDLPAEEARQLAIRAVRQEVERIKQTPDYDLRKHAAGAAAGAVAGGTGTPPAENEPTRMWFSEVELVGNQLCFSGKIIDVSPEALRQLASVLKGKFLVKCERQGDPTTYLLSDLATWLADEQGDNDEDDDGSEDEEDEDTLD